MQRLRSAVDTESQSYKANYSWMSQAIARLQQELRKSTEGGGEKYVKRHIERGRLLPRERIELLLDEGSYFLDIAPLAGIGMENESCGNAGASAMVLCVTGRGGARQVALAGRESRPNGAGWTAMSGGGWPAVLSHPAKTSKAISARMVRA